MSKNFFILAVFFVFTLSSCATPEEAGKDPVPAIDRRTDLINVTVDESDRSGWLTYRNSWFGFEMDYPPEWTAQPSGGTATLSKGNIVIRVMGVEISPPYQNADEELENLKYMYREQTYDSKLGGLNAMVRDDEGGGRAYYLPHGNYYAEIMVNRETMEKNPVVGQIISTIRFGD